MGTNALYRCKQCGYLHKIPVQSAAPVSQQTAVDMISKIVVRSHTTPRQDLGELPKYFTCKCDTHHVGIAELVGLEF